MKALWDSSAVFNSLKEKTKLPKLLRVPLVTEGIDAHYKIYREET